MAESFNREAWAAWIGPERDGDGQATTIHVCTTTGAHVTEADAEEIRRRLRPAEAAALNVELLARDLDKHWLNFDSAGRTATCTCGEWALDFKTTAPLALGEHLRPFSDHVAAAISAAYAALRESEEGQRG